LLQISHFNDFYEISMKRTFCKDSIIFLLLLMLLFLICDAGKRT
jgi:hypothetical protein